MTAANSKNFSRLLPLGFAITLASMITQPAYAASDAIPVQVPAGTTLVIADDADNGHSVLQLSGEQDKLAEKVTYANFSSGPLRLEAIRAGAAQVGVVGDVPPILAQFSGADVVIVAAIRYSGDQQNIATAAGSGIRALADLKGKKIGINQGTGQQALLLRDLQSVGLSIKDVQPINLGVDQFVDALRADQIDAAVLKQPDRARYLATAGQGATQIPNTPDIILASGLDYLYASRTALADPAQAAAIRDFVIHWYRGELWLNTHQDIWISDYLIKDQKLKHDDAKVVSLSLGDHTTIPGLTDDLIAAQQKTIDLLQASGAFGGKPLQANDEFDLRFRDLNDKSQAAHD